jgi:hypothetical protein
VSRDDSRSRRPGEKEEWESLGVGQACRISQFRPLDSQPFGETDANVAQSLSAPCRSRARLRNDYPCRSGSDLRVVLLHRNSGRVLPILWGDDMTNLISTAQLHLPIIRPFPLPKPLVHIHRVR